MGKRMKSLDGYHIGKLLFSEVLLLQQMGQYIIKFSSLVVIIFTLLINDKSVNVDRAVT